MPTDCPLRRALYRVGDEVYLGDQNSVFVALSQLKFEMHNYYYRAKKEDCVYCNTGIYHVFSTGLEMKLFEKT